MNDKIDIDREWEFLKNLGVIYSDDEIKAEAHRLGLIGKWWQRLTQKKKYKALWSLMDNKGENKHGIKTI